jgi:gamma-glutamyltranspeptidase
MLERLARLPSYTEDAATIHAMIEAWKLVPSARNRIADPGLWPVNISAFTSKDSARARWNCFDAQRALTSSELSGDTPKCAMARTGGAAKDSASGAASDTGRKQGRADAGNNMLATECGGTDAEEGESDCHRTGTTAFTVGDADGNVVAVTQTLGTWGGSFYVSPGLGFLYNDKVTSYGSDSAAFGGRAPFARNGSTLAPTIVFRGSGAKLRPVLAVGAAGNSWITSAVYSIVEGVLDQKLDVQHAIELPRFLLSRDRVGNRSDFVVELEDGFAPSMERDLEKFGDRLRFISLPGELRMGYAAAVTFSDRTVTAGADPRRAGAAGAIEAEGKGKRQ